MVRSSAHRGGRAGGGERIPRYRNFSGSRAHGGSRAHLLLLAAILGPFAAGASAAGASEGPSPLEAPLVVTRIPVASRPSGAAETELDLDRARIAVIRPGRAPFPLAADLAAARDPDVSFDGRRVVFSGRETPLDPWSLWEVEVAGGPPRRITRDSADCTQPIYVSSLYTLDSSEPWYTVVYTRREPVRDETGRGPTCDLWSIGLDGDEPRRLTCGPGFERDPFQAPDGRLIYSGWSHAPESALGRGRDVLFGLNIDGIDLALYGESRAPFERSPCVTSRGIVVLTHSMRERPDGAGGLATLRTRRPHHSWRELSDGTRWLERAPSPLPAGEVLVARRPREGGGDWGIWILDPATGRFRPRLDERGWHEIAARFLGPRPEPDGRSTVVDPAYRTGILYCLNIYDADERFRRHLAPGSIRRLRVIEGLPSPVSRAGGPPTASRLDPERAVELSAVRRRLLGEAPIERDGSFHIEVPADVPILLQPLDEHGLAFSTCNWIWVKRREKRGCIGCHEDPELTPENIFVEAAQRPPNRLTLPPERRRRVTFLADVWPIVQRRCARAECHADERSPLRLALAPGGAGSADARMAWRRLLEPAAGDSGSPEDSGRGRHVDPGRARTSVLVWQLLGEDTTRAWDRRRGVRYPGKDLRTMPPPDAPPLTPEEKRIFIEWIDLGAAWGDDEASVATSGSAPSPATTLDPPLARSPTTAQRPRP